MLVLIWKEIKKKTFFIGLFKKKISLWNFDLVINSYLYVIKNLSHIYL